MLLGKLSVPWRPTLTWIIVWQGPSALPVGAGGGCLDFVFSQISFLSFWCLSLGDGTI